MSKLSQSIEQFKPIIKKCENINQLTAEILILKQQTAQNIIEIGKRLIEVKESLPHGEFGKWLEEKVEFSKSTAYRFINTAEQFGNFPTLGNLNQSKIFLLLEVPQEDREEFIATNPVEDMTTRELEKAIKEKKQLEQDLEIERNKPPVIKEIEKTIIPVDYYEAKTKMLKMEQDQKQKQSQLEQLERDKGYLEKKIKLKEDEAQIYKKSSDEYRELQSQINNARQEKSDISRQIEAIKSISGLIFEIEKTLKTQLAPIKYSRAIQELQNDEIVIKNITEILDRVQSWLDEMYSLIPNTIINMGVAINE